MPTRKTRGGGAAGAANAHRGTPGTGWTSSSILAKPQATKKLMKLNKLNATSKALSTVGSELKKSGNPFGVVGSSQKRKRK